MSGKTTFPDRNDRAGHGRILPVLAILLVMASPMAMAANGGGSLTETISGYVFDETGIPAEGVLVNVEHTSVGAPTDSNGHYFLRGVDLDGQGTLIFTADGYLTARVEYDLQDGGRISRSPFLVEVEEEAGEVVGTVTAFDGSPVEGALLTMTGNGLPSTSVRTGPEGNFRFRDLSPEEVDYTLTVEAEGHMTINVTALVEAGAETHLDIVLLPEVPMELVRGSVTDGRGLPLPGATIALEGSRDEWTTDIDGTFSALVDERKRTRDVTVSLNGYVDKTYPVDIPEPGVATVHLRLDITGNGGPETLWIEVVNAQTGEPLEGATVTLEGQERTRTTDAMGRTIMTRDDIEGRQTIFVSKDRFTSAAEIFELEDGGSGSIRMSITRTSNAVSLEGVVTDASTHEQVVDAVVTVNAEGIIWLIHTDADGHFLIHNLPPGVSTIVAVSAPGYSVLEMETTLEEFALNHVELEMESDRPAHAAVHGAVADDAGPVQGALVTFWKEGFDAVTRTDEVGEFSITEIPVPGGPVYYMVEDQDHVPYSGQLDMPTEDELLGLEVFLEHEIATRTVVIGDVTDLDGYPIEHARVLLFAGGSTWETRSIEGVFEFYLDVDTDMAGELSVTGEGYGWNNQTTTIRTRFVNEVDVELSLGPGFSNVVGTISTDPGRPLDGVEVRLSYLNAYNEVTISEADGSYAFRLVPSRDEPYTLAVMAEGYDGVTLPATTLSGKTSPYDLTLREDVTSVETIHGAVLNSYGEPMASTVISIGTTHTVLSEANGSFVLVAEDLEGWQTISASSPGFETIHRSLEIDPGETMGVEFVLSVSDGWSVSVRGMVVKAHDGKAIEGATVRLGWYGSDNWTFETATNAQGMFTFDLVPRAWGHVTVTVSVEGFWGDAHDEILRDTEPTWFEFYLRRDEVVEPEPPMVTEQQAKQVGIGVGVTVAVIAAILATEVGKVALLGLLLVPLYTKIKREKVMDHFIRGRIYEFICSNPGVNYSSIKEQFKLTNGTVTYHLSMLERQEFIRAKQDGIYKRYFSNNGGPAVSDVQPMSLQLSIAKAIREEPGMTQKEIATRLGSSKQLVSYHLRNMKKDGLLDTHRDGRSVRIYPNPRTPE